jgi:accessory gene regulator B
MILIDVLYQYFKNEFNLSEIDSIKLRYSLEVITNDLSKYLILLALFSACGKITDFIYSSLALIMIRSFTGGLHFASYIRCIVFTGLFFCTSILLKTYVYLNSTITISLFIFSLSTVILFAPLCSKSRPEYSIKKRFNFKLIGALLLILNFGMYFLATKNPYLINSVWVMSLQSFQILIAKGVKLYEKRKSSFQTTT